MSFPWWSFGVFVLIFAVGLDLVYGGIEKAMRIAQQTSPSTITVVDSPTPVETPAKTVATTSTNTATTTKKSTPPSPAASTATSSIKKPVTLTITQVHQPSQSEFEAAGTSLKKALVNILCISGRRDIPSISGSGVFIDPKGVVITNAHIAQYFLYTTDPTLQVSCMLRAGSPAQNAYRANLIFIPATWVNANATILSEQDPTGNGEYDFALLAITGSATNAPLPTTFPFIPLSSSVAYAGEPVVIGSYAAQFLSSSEIQSSLYPTVVFGSIEAVFTFIKTTIDVITLGGSAAAQEGSSGGGIALAGNTLAGIITTSTTEGSTADRTLGGITASYISREYHTESGTTIEDFLSKLPTEAAAEFAPQIPALRATLTASLSK